MHNGDTIVAIASGPVVAGAGDAPARAIVRASGPGVAKIVEAMVVGMPRDGRWVGAVRVRVSSVAGEKTTPLENSACGTVPCLAIRCAAPRSYTGEDTLELVMVSNAELVRRVMAAMLAMDGVRAAEAGEYSARAYLHGKLTLDQAEGVASVIAAGSAAQLEGARAVLEGRAGTEYRGWAEEIATLLALVEAGIDFTDQEDVVPIGPGDLRSRVDALLRAMEARLGARAGAALATWRPRVVLAGAPNAGKSTLFNALLGRRRAVTSDVAGTTRDAIVETITLSEDARGPITAELVDLAGLDAALATRHGIDDAAQRAAMDEVQRASVVVWCAAAGEREAACPLVIAERQRLVWVRTKADRVMESALSPRPNPLPSPLSLGGGVRVCALDGFGLAALRTALYDAAWGAAGGAGGLLPRHAAAVEGAAAQLRLLRDQTSTAPNTRGIASPEICAGLLREALDELGTLTGRVERDEIIGRIFTAFCIGK